MSAWPSKPADDPQALPGAERRRRVTAAKIMKAQTCKPRLAADHLPRLEEGDRHTVIGCEHPGAPVAARLRGEDCARRRRQPDRPRPRLGVRQYGPVAMDVLPSETQRLRLARFGVEQEAHRRDRDRILDLDLCERQPERRELRIGQVVRLEPALAPPQISARVRPSGRRPRSSACFISEDRTASDLFAVAARVTDNSSNQLRRRAR